MADIPTVAQAWRFPVDQSAWKGHQSLQLREVKLSPPGKGEVLVRLYAAALNYSRRVVALGDGVTQWKKGDRVHSLFFETWLDGPILPEHNFQALGAGTLVVFLSTGWFNFMHFSLQGRNSATYPDHLSYEEAATLPCAALTAWNSFFERKPVTDKSTVLVLGSGGVSVFGAQLAKAAGARVIATTSSEAKAQKYRALGVDEVVNYRSTLNGGEGTVFQSIKSIERGGMIHVIGAVASGTSAGGDVQELGTLILITPATLSGVQVGSKAMCQRLDIFVTKHAIKPVIDRVFGWTEAIEAF
ncbi:Zinc-binding dehydrogenase [Rhizoctonia solani]|uniref:Zinc-binding dehydrogenase n=1 Tax=Rhizoctonia solani TaxID=456999 RepID=A0A8H7IMJ5_9AGAM|nr:Zinc-binding dehydrogenase [Rhizoctonia solani]